MPRSIIIKEAALNKNKLLRIAGIDEAGRGPLAGPVYAAAVILNPLKPIRGLKDSKLLTPEKRERLAIEIKANSLAWAVAFADVEEIDKINILQASLLAMQRAVHALAVKPDEALVDGNQCPKLVCPVTAIIRGDQLIPAISAASILAKVSRDHLMIQLDKKYPNYGFAQHKGYATELHLSKLEELGSTPIHRKTFAPVYAQLQLEVVQE